jgi:hypothetical protein
MAQSSVATFHLLGLAFVSKSQMNAGVIKQSEVGWAAIAV